MSCVVSALGYLPGPLGRGALNLLVGKVIPFVGTSGVVIEEMTTERVTAVVPNRWRVRNHIGQVHAAAMALAVETASGLVVGMNVPDSKLPLIKSMRVDYRRRSRGAIRATARLTQAQRMEIAALEKGQVAVEVTAVDDSGQEPIECTMVWAWVPKRR